MHESLQKNSLQPKSASHNNTSWYTDTDGFLELSPSGGSLYYKGPMLQKIIPIVCPTSYIYNVVQPSPTSISITLLSLRTETLYPLGSNSSCHPAPQPLATTTLLAVSVTLTTLSSSYKWSHTIFVLSLA